MDINKTVTKIFHGEVTAEGQTLNLPDGVCWPCASNNILFVRTYYRPLFESVLNECNRKLARREHRYVLTGQPGIGKSVFGWYVIYRLLTDKSKPTINIAYMHKDIGDTSVLLIHKTITSCQVTLHTKDQFLRQPKGDSQQFVLISDTVAPAMVDSVIVWISSPGWLEEKASKEILKSFCTTRIYMPLTSCEELLEMNNCTFQDNKLSQEALKARVNLWGPIPRLVFDLSPIEVQYAEVVKLKRLNLEEIQKAYKFVRFQTHEGDNPKHSIFVERAAGQDLVGVQNISLEMLKKSFYHRGATAIASQPISSLIMRVIKSLSIHEAADFVFSSVGVGEHGSRRGTLFEELALKVLASGGSFEVRDLRNKSTSVWSISQSTIVDWDRKSTMTLENMALENTILVPTVKNEEGLDALLWIHSLSHHVPIDFTVSNRHGIHQIGLANHLRKLGARGWTIDHGWAAARDHVTKEVPYIWVVPEDKFNLWNHEQSAKANSEHMICNYLAQYVLKMPYERLFQAVDLQDADTEVDNAFRKIQNLT